MSTRSDQIAENYREDRTRTNILLRMGRVITQEDLDRERKELRARIKYEKTWRYKLKMAMLDYRNRKAIKR